MHLRCLVTFVSVIAAIMLAIVVKQAEAQEVKGREEQTCWLPNGWDPAEDLPRILSEHRRWAEQWTIEKWSRKWARDFHQGQANLCNADLSNANLTGADLTGADLTGANLTGVNLTKANLNRADLTKANLTKANLTKINLYTSNLTGADLTRANLTEAWLNNANLTGADLLGASLTDASLFATDLTKARLNGTDLTKARLNYANLTKALLSYANLTEAWLIGANLTEARLNNANLTEARLSGANLTKARLNNANLTKARLNNANLTEAVLDRSNLTATTLANADLTASTYAPASPAPNAFIAGIQGLQTVVFPKGREIGLVQLRELLQKAGLRDLEREATYAIERGRTLHSITEGNLFEALEGLFRFIAFDLTTGYGLHPGRALGIILIVGIVLSWVYVWAICLPVKWPNSSSGIYQVWPTDRIEVNWNYAKLGSQVKVERLFRSGYTQQRAVLGYAAYFSLLSAFHIGWRDLNVGTWISRIQPHEYALRATGWVRVVSGIQSLLSVYLLAIWVLTYFGRPFQ